MLYCNHCITHGNTPQTRIHFPNFFRQFFTFPHFSRSVSNLPTFPGTSPPKTKALAYHISGAFITHSGQERSVNYMKHINKGSSLPHFRCFHHSFRTGEVCELYKTYKQRLQPTTFQVLSPLIQDRRGP